MKNILLLVTFLLSSCLVSCVSTDDYENDTNNIQKEILFNASTVYKKAGTRNAPSYNYIVEGTSLPANTYFGVYGYAKPSTYTEGGYVMKNAQYNNLGSSDTKYYWPMADDNTDLKFKFVAYFPYTDDSNVQSLDANGIFTYHVDASATKNGELTDVLYAITNDVSPLLNSNANAADDNAKVDLEFKHALSCVQFQARKADYIEKVKITSITFSDNLYTTGDITINTKNNQTTASISNPGGAQSLEFAQEAVKDNLLDTYKILSTATIIPQNVPTSVTITFDITIKNPDDNSTIEYKNRTITRTINTGKDDNNKTYATAWEASNRYIYRIFIKADDVDFNVSVENWTNVNWYQVWDHDETDANTNINF